jgi:Protein of unknown function (DUF2568)
MASPSRGEPPPIAGWRGAVLAVRFVSELALLAVLAIVGRHVSVALAVLLPVLAAVLWGVLLAPKARRRLPDPGRLVVELALFAGSAAALATAGYVFVAIVFGVVAVGCAAVVRAVSPGA